MDEFSDKKIIESWQKNAKPWIKAVQNKEIASRKLVTDAAILTAIQDQNIQRIWDLGCGEGFLARALAEQGMQVWGSDIIPELIESAQETGVGEFKVLAYEDIQEDSFPLKFDGIVCNFSLFGKESVEHLFKTLPKLLSQPGKFIIQSLHPIHACGDLPYEDAWRTGSWAGFSDEFTDPAPWYFRTLESWKDLFQTSEFELLEIREPLHPDTQVPASIIFIAEKHES